MAIKIVLRNPLNKEDQVDYNILVEEHPMAASWVESLKNILRENKYLEKNFCFLGFPNSPRNLEYICQELELAKKQINSFFDPGDYYIGQLFVPDNLQFKLEPNQGMMNVLHNHFEKLQGTVDNLSDYYRRADYPTKFAIRQLNNLCHEAESFMLSKRKEAEAPDWVRPSQITTFLNAQRHTFPQEYKNVFSPSNYDREFGGVYLHWSQIGKTIFEVFQNEKVENIDNAVCEAITNLQYYSGEFDIEWAQTIKFNGGHPWHTVEMTLFKNWLEKNNIDLSDKNYNFGYHKIGQVDLKNSFGTDNFKEVWPILSSHLDIYKIEVDGVSVTYDYTWTDSDYYEQQINRLKFGYDHSSR